MSPVASVAPAVRLKYFALEPRIAFDAALADVVAETVGHAGTVDPFVDNDPATNESTTADPTPAPIDPTDIAGERIIVIDPTVNGFETLLEQVPAGTIAVVIDPGMDGLAQAADYLAGRCDVASVELVGCGDGDTLRIGRSVIDPDAFDAESRDALTRIEAALTPDGSFTFRSVPPDPESQSGDPGVLEPATGSPQAAPTIVDEPPCSDVRELIVIDATVPDAQRFVDDIVARAGYREGSVAMLVLDGSADGIRQITDALAGYSGLDAIHIISHGSTGELWLGTAGLRLDTLEGYASQMTAWCGALAPDADILLYGCDVAAGPDGAAFVDALARITDADVAASDDPTGSAHLGGDWDFEVATGVISARLAPSLEVQGSYGYVLATYTVTNTNNSGAGSLRQAILNANANSGPDTINFNIPGTGVHTIAPTSPLPTITGTVTLDATTDDSFAANGSRPAIILAGTNAGSSADGLVLGDGADGSTIRGFVIRDFGDDGIVIEAGSNNNLVTGNYIGRLDADGSAAASGTENGEDGIAIYGANNTIGGATSADRNVISGNADYGIWIEGFGATGNKIIGNYIGTDASGTVDVGNGRAGVLVYQASGNFIGTPNANEGNLISGNNQDGVELSGTNATGNKVQGNWIGLTSGGSPTLGNSYDGVWLSGGAANNLIGGVETGAGNIVAGNGGDGILLNFDAGTGNAILGNSIYANSERGIDLNDGGVTPNDLGDGDSGPNNLQNYPVLTSASVGGS